MHIRILLSLLFLFVSYIGNACNVTISASAPAICVGQQVMLVADGATNYSWAPTASMNDTIWVSPTVTTTYTVIGTGPANCNDTATITITVTPYPNVTVTSPADTICAGVNNTMTATGAGLYAWSPGSHSGSSFNPKPEVTTTYTIIGTNNPGGCKDTAYKTIYVKAAPKPVLTDLNVFSAFNNCSNTTGLPNYNLNVTTANNPSISSYGVNWGDGSPALNNLAYASFIPFLNKTYSAFGVFNLTFTANYANGCSRDSIYKVINQTNPSVGCTGPGNTQGCAPVQYCFKLTGYQQNSPGTIYVWNFGDGTTVTWNSVTVDSICHTFNQSSCTQPSGQYTVSVKAINSCDSTTATVNNVRVGKKPTAIFTLPDTTFCINTPVQPTNVSIPALNTPGCTNFTTYYWNFGDPNTIADTSNLYTPAPYSYSVPGTYTITLVATGNCGPDTMKKVICIENNIVNFTLSNFNACAPSQVTLTNTSPSTDCIPSPYTWTITQQIPGCTADSANNFVFVSGNATSNSPVIRFNNQGTYRIRLSHTNKCGLVFKDTLITIKRKPLIAITAPSSICLGNAITPTASVQACAGTLGVGTWSFPAATPNTSTSATPSFAAPVGTHIFTYAVSNECGSSTKADTIQVLPQPTLAITSSAGAAICIGQPTTLTATGANTYLWSGGSTNAVLTVTPTVTTTYTVTGTTALGCTKSSTITITVNPLPIISLSVTPPTCVPGADGVIAVSASNGTPAYMYQLNANPFQASNTFSNLSPNVYTVTVKDANNCTKTSIQNVASPNSPNITGVVKTNVSCFGGTNATIQVFASGGTGALTYVLQPGAVTNSNGTYTGLNTNVYTITVTDVSGCTSITTVNITQPAILNATLTATPVVCNGQSNGSVTTTVTGGTPNYLYQILPLGTTNSTGVFNGLSVGTYTVLVTDSKSCTKTATIAVAQPPVLIWANTSSQNVSCFNGSTGSISVALSGGVTPYNYTLQPVNVNNTTGSFTGLSSATYTITGRDANNCTISTVITITQPPVLSFTTSLLPPTCSPGNDATLTINASGGTPSYTYQINNNGFVGTNVFPSMGTGTYTITVKDANNCTKTSIQTIAAPNSPVISSVNQVNVSCNGGSNASMQVFAGGGTGTLTYVLQPGAVTNTIGTFSGLNANVYTITVTDVSGCTSITTINITQPAILNATLTATPVVCNGQSNGSVTTSVTGGTPNYLYQILPLGTSNSTGVFNGLSVGTYTVLVTDSKSCTKTATIAVTQPAVLTWATSNSQNVDCFNNATGSISVTLSGGVSPYNFTRQPGNVSSSTGLFTGLTSGTYTITGSDANNCTKTTVFTITQPSNLLFTTLLTPPSCVPGNDASLTINASGGVPTYSYQLNNASFIATITYTNLGVGVYTITVKDGNNCTKTSSINISSPNAPSINSVSQVNVSCNGGANGSMQVNASGGTGALSYNLQPLNQTNTSGLFTGLLANNYTITVTDASGCTSTSLIIITQPAVLTASLSNTTVVCFGQSNGSITTTASGGTTPYAYQLQPNAVNNTSGQFSNLPIGTYTVLVTDFKGCTKTATTTITQPTSLTWSTTNTQAVVCNNGNTGSLSAILNGGVSPYNYTCQPNNVSNGTGTFTNLTAGVYTILGTDANGCTKSTTLTVNQPTPLNVISVVNTIPTCVPGNDATLSFSGAGGVGPYNYAISPSFIFGANSSFNNLAAGTYTIQVKDANQCTKSATQVISVPNAPQIQSIAVVNSTCNPGNNGSLTIAANGGTGTLQYNINTNPNVFVSTNVFSGLSNATYTITVKDASGCTSTSTATIITPSGPVITGVSTINATCNPGCNGSIQVSATSAFTLQYQSNSSQFQNSSSITSVCAGTYTITVKDANQCTATTTVVINTNNTLVLVSDSVKQVTCFGANNGKIYLSSTGGALPVNYTLQPGNISNTNGDFLNLSPNVYTITAIDVAGCSQSTTVQITQPTLLSITSISSINVSCFGGNNGSITASASGGTGTKTYTRQPGNQSNTTGSFANLIAGTYTITVRDANLCSVSSTVVITQPSPLLINAISNTQPACVPANSATLNITASGGVASYLYSIGGPFQASSAFNNLTPNTYTISVSDANNCSVTSTWIIAVPNAPQITNVSVNPVLCFGQSNGSFTVIANGGTGALNYVAQPNNLSNTNGQFSSLLAGTYTVTVTDQLGCTSGTQAIINQPANLFFVSATSGTALCNNSNTGSVSAVVNGGVLPYTFTLQPNNTTNSNGNFTNLSSGVYTIVVSDANGCSKTTTVSVGQPNALNFNTVALTAVSCFAGNNGTLIRTATGGSGLITYALNPGGLNNTNGTFNSLSAGIYTLTATDANGCSISATHTIVQPTLLKIDSIISSAPSCAPMSISVLVSGGIPSYTYAINGGSSGPSNVFTNLGAGTYTISVVDANGCVKTATKTLVLPNQPQITSVGVTSPTCFGLSNGAITSIVPAGGASPYVISVSPGNSFNNLTAGTYTVMATDANSCSVTSLVTISQPAPISLLSSISNQVLCHNQTNGSLQFTGTGGTGVLTYTLINSGSSNTNGQFNNLAGGVYTIQITDANSCTFTSTQSVFNPPAIVFTSVSYTPITCNGLNNGSFVTQSGGGTGLLTYSIFPSVIASNTSGIFNPLAANNYTVTVTDINGCAKDTAITVLQPPPVTGTYLVQSQVTCFGGQNGQFTVFANSGYAPFQFYLLGSASVNSSGVFSNLQAGTYTVQLVDSAFCTSTIGPIQITQPTPIVWDSIYIPHIRCYGDLTDSLRVKASGGVGNFNYSIAPLGPQTNALGRFNNLTGQVYTITAIDANGCSATTTVTITQNDAIVFPVFNIQYPACFGDSNGRIEVYGSGGVPPLLYQLNGSAPSTNSVYPNLKAGLYTIRITDALNCIRDTTVLLTQLNQLQLTTLSVGPEICSEGNDATIYVQATGGVGNLVYGLLPDSLTNSSGLFTPLSAGTYTLFISDSAGCALDSTVVVTPTLNPLEISISKNNLGCLGVGTEGYAIADVTGGAQPYSYLWNTNPPQVTPKASDLRFGYYIVQVSDVKGCTISDTVYIEPGTCCEEVFIPSAFTPNGDGLNDVFRCVTAAGLQVIQFDVFNRWGERVWSTDDYTKGWDGTNKGQLVGPNEVFYYTFVYRCLTDGKTYSRKGDVTVLR